MKIETMSDQFKQLADRLNPNKGDDPNHKELDY